MRPGSSQDPGPYLDTRREGPDTRLGALAPWQLQMNLAVPADRVAGESATPPPMMVQLSCSITRHRIAEQPAGDGADDRRGAAVAAMASNSVRGRHSPPTVVPAAIAAIVITAVAAP